MDLLGVMSGGFDTDKKTVAGSGIDIVVVSKLEGTIREKHQLTGTIKTVSQLVGIIEGNMKSSDIELYRGDSRTLEVTVSDENGPANLTGSTVKFSVKKKKGDTAYIIKKSTTDPSEINIVDAVNGKLEIYLIPDDTQDVAIASYHFDVEVETSTNKIYTVVAGKLSILEDITKPDF
ncbi:MAG: BppU family phage baseplate upper protein [bacterium]